MRACASEKSIYRKNRILLIRAKRQTNKLYTDRIRGRGLNTKIRSLLKRELHFEQGQIKHDVRKTVYK